MPLPVRLLHILILFYTIPPQTQSFFNSYFTLQANISGLGAAGLGNGALTVISRNFPNHKRPLITGFFGASQAIGLVSAPIIGGALGDAFTWRACFGINIPIGILAVIITLTCLTDPFPNPALDLPLRQKLLRLDLLGTALIIPAIVSLMLGLQWGGIRYGWSDWRIILLIAVFVILVLGFGYAQHKKGDDAVLPLRILKNRTVLAAALFSCCTNGLLATTESYISVYFQGVRGFSATKAGLLGLPMIAGLALTGLLAAFGMTWVGYYTRKSALAFLYICLHLFIISQHNLSTAISNLSTPSNTNTLFLSRGQGPQEVHL